jgi:hypothetical protein
MSAALEGQLIEEKDNVQPKEIVLCVECIHLMKIF